MSRIMYQCFDLGLLLPPAHGYSPREQLVIGRPIFLLLQNVQKLQF